MYSSLNSERPLDFDFIFLALFDLSLPTIECVEIVLVRTTIRIKAEHNSLICGNCSQFFNERIYSILI